MKWPEAASQNSTLPSEQPSARRPSCKSKAQMAGAWAGGGSGGLAGGVFNCSTEDNWNVVVEGTGLER